MRIDSFDMTPGKDLLIGPPNDRQLTESVLSQLQRVLANIRGILEAHVPQCYIPDISDAPVQVLVLVLEAKTNPDSVMERLAPQLHAIVPRGLYLDVWPLPEAHELVPKVQAAGARFFSSEK